MVPLLYKRLLVVLVPLLAVGAYFMLSQHETSTYGSHQVEAFDDEAAVVLGPGEQMDAPVDVQPAAASDQQLQHSLTNSIKDILSFPRYVHEEDYRLRVAWLRQQRADFTVEELRELYHAIRSGDYEAQGDREHYYAIVNEVFSLFHARRDDFQDYDVALLTIAQASELAPVVREYGIQFYSVALEARILADADSLEAVGEEAVRALSAACSDTTVGVTGTALLAMTSLAGGMPADSPLLAAVLAESSRVLSDRGYDGVDRSSALQACVRIDPNLALEMTRNQIQQESHSLVQLSMLHVLRRMGNTTDLELIQRFQLSDNPTLQQAAHVAQQQLSSDA